MKTTVDNTDKKHENRKKDSKIFMIRMFAMNEKGQTASICVKDFKPYFYVKVGSFWNHKTVGGFLNQIKEQLRKNN